MIGCWITNSQNIKQKDVIMPFCGECGAEVPAGVNFCGKCGASAGIARSAPPDDAQINFDEFKDKTLFWKKPAYVVLGVIGVVLLIAAVTNPGEWKHRRAVAALVYNEFSKTDEGMIVDGVLGILGDKSGSVGTAFTASTLRSKITSRNYLFFSLTTVIESGDIIGVGVFGNVYLFEDTLPYLGGDNDDEPQTRSIPAQQNNTGTAQSVASGGKIDNRLVGKWCDWGDGDGCFVFRANGTFSYIDYDYETEKDYETTGRWSTVGNKITMTFSNGNTTVDTYSINNTDDRGITGTILYFDSGRDKYGKVAME
jgi:hypothetical protein